MGLRRFEGNGGRIPIAWRDEGDSSGRVALPGTIDVGPFHTTPSFSADRRRIRFASTAERPRRPAGLADIYQAPLPQGESRPTSSRTAPGLVRARFKPSRNGETMILTAFVTLATIAGAGANCARRGASADAEELEHLLLEDFAHRPSGALRSVRSPRIATLRGSIPRSNGSPPLRRACWAADDRAGQTSFALRSIISTGASANRSPAPGERSRTGFSITRYRGRASRSMKMARPCGWSGRPAIRLARSCSNIPICRRSSALRRHPPRSLPVALTLTAPAIAPCGARPVGNSVPSGT